jgi:hypothetical protein
MNGTVFHMQREPERVDDGTCPLVAGLGELLAVGVELLVRGARA